MFPKIFNDNSCEFRLGSEFRQLFSEYLRVKGLEPGGNTLTTIDNESAFSLIASGREPPPAEFFQFCKEKLRKDRMPWLSLDMTATEFNYAYWYSLYLVGMLNINEQDITLLWWQLERAIERYARDLDTYRVRTIRLTPTQYRHLNQSLFNLLPKPAELVMGQLPLDLLDIYNQFNAVAISVGEHNLSCDFWQAISRIAKNSLKLSVLGNFNSDIMLET